MPKNKLLFLSPLLLAAACSAPVEKLWINRV